MIIDVRKYLVLGTNDDLEIFFERAQENGFMEFISPVSRKNVEQPSEVQNLITALKILKKLPVKKSYEGLWEIPYANYVAKRVIELRDEIERLLEEKRLTDAEIHRVAPFGDFSMHDIEYIENQGHKKIQFYCIKSSKDSPDILCDQLIYISTEYDLDFYMAINSLPKTYPDMIEMRIDRSVGELKIHENMIKESIHELEAELKGYTGHVEFLYDTLLELLNDLNLSIAQKEVSSPIAGSCLFSVEAWVPKSKEHLIHPLLEGLSVHCERIRAEEQDRMPTYLENKGLNVLGEDLVKIYDIPATSDKDPSGWVFWFFALFFAIIVADGGYGLLYLATAIYLKYKFPTLKGSSKRLWKLFTILSCFVVGWGLLTSSFFGLRIHRNSFLGKISPLQYLVKQKAAYHLQAKDDVYEFWAEDFPKIKTATTADQFLDEVVTVRDHITSYPAKEAFSNNILLEFSLIIGIIHVAFSLFRYLFRNWAGLGWIALMVGGYFFFPIKLSATSIVQFMGWMDVTTLREIGLQLIYTGLGIATFLALIQKRLGGISEIVNVIQVFADVLSYLRLYALALAGSIMATTFNDMGMAIGLLGGFVVIIAGHAVNILLGVMAGVIHGLRLNFIEWYHYSFEGGGRLFNPLKLLKSEEE